jgi:hypothetical protein
MRSRLVILAIWLAMVAPGIALAEPVKIAPWNLQNLRAQSGEGFNPREDEDYERLAAVARRLNADVVALQEVEDAGAAARVFDPAEYAFFISRRQFSPGDRQRIRTGFAVRRWCGRTRISPTSTSPARSGTASTLP